MRASDRCIKVELACLLVRCRVGPVLDGNLRLGNDFFVALGLGRVGHLTLNVARAVTLDEKLLGNLLSLGLILGGRVGLALLNIISRVISGALTHDLELGDLLLV